MRIELLVDEVATRWPELFEELWTEASKKPFMNGLGSRCLSWTVVAGVDVDGKEEMPRDSSARIAFKLERTMALLECRYGGFARSRPLPTIPPEVRRWIELTVTEATRRKVLRKLNAEFPKVLRFR